jgi:hypothetical protein
MDFLKIFQSITSNSLIRVDIDPALYSKLNTHGFIPGENLEIKLNHYKLLTSIGLLEPKRYNTDRPKINDYLSLYTWIKNTPEFKVIKSHISSVQKRNSEELGVGVAIQLTKKLFKINESTISKIKETNEKTMDFTCLSCNGEIINVEAKGSTSMYTRTKQIKHGLEQKIEGLNRNSADLKIISATLLNESAISHCIYRDPLAISPLDPEYKIKLMKADHYSRVFNLMGQKELSKYFGFMKKRLMYDKDFKEVKEKEYLYTKLKEDSLKFKFNNKEFIGNIYIVGKNQYQFVGFDKNLLSLSGFIDFQEYNSEIVISSEKNKIIISTDGLCIIYIRELNSLQDEFKKEINKMIENKDIKHYQEYTSIYDLDMMNELAVEQYFNYLFFKAGYKVINECKHGNIRSDFFIIKKDKKYIIEIKINTKLDIDKIEGQLLKYRDFSAKVVLITNKNINKNNLLKLKKKEIIIIDRQSLMSILNNSVALNEFL